MLYVDDSYNNNEKSKKIKYRLKKGKNGEKSSHFRVEIDEEGNEIEIPVIISKKKSKWTFYKIGKNNRWQITC